MVRQISSSIVRGMCTANRAHIQPQIRAEMDKSAIPALRTLWRKLLWRGRLSRPKAAITPLCLAIDREKQRPAYRLIACLWRVRDTTAIFRRPQISSAANIGHGKAMWPSYTPLASFTPFSLYSLIIRLSFCSTKRTSHHIFTILAHEHVGKF